MMQIKVHPRMIFWVKLASILFIFTLLLFILHVGYALFVPLFAGFLMAILLYPVSRFFEKLHLGANLSAIISVLLFMLLIAGIALLLANEIILFSKDLPHTIEKLSSITERIQNRVAALFHLNNHNAAPLHMPVNEFYTSIKGLISSTLLSTIKTGILVIIFLFFTFFILVYRTLLIRFIISLFKETDKLKATHVIYTIRALINSYLIGLLSEMGIVFVLLFIMLAIMGIKFALMLALLAAIINIIPYLGIYTAGALSMLITLVYSSETKVLEVAGIFAVVHLLDANVLIPYIVGHRVKVNPLMAFVALITGELIWGIPGMFLFIPLTAIFRIIIQNIPDLKPWAALIGEENKIKPG